MSEKIQLTKGEIIAGLAQLRKDYGGLEYPVTDNVLSSAIARINALQSKADMLEEAVGLLFQFQKCDHYDPIAVEIAQDNARAFLARIQEKQDGNG